MIILSLAALLHAPPQIAEKIIAFPPGVYCGRRGGHLELRKFRGVQRSYCVLPDGRRIEQWKFYRDNNPPIRNGTGGIKPPGRL